MCWSRRIILYNFINFWNFFQDLYWFRRLKRWFLNKSFIKHWTTYCRPYLKHLLFCPEIFQHCCCKVNFRYNKELNHERSECMLTVDLCMCASTCVSLCTCLCMCGWLVGLMVHIGLCHLATSLLKPVKKNSHYNKNLR